MQKRMSRMVGIERENRYVSETAGTVWEDMKATAYAKLVDGPTERTVKMLGVAMRFDVGTLLYA